MAIAPPSSSKLQSRQMVRPGAAGSPSAASSVSTAPAHTPPAGPLRLPTPNNGAGMALVPTPVRPVDMSRISAGGDTFFDWSNAASSPLAPLQQSSSHSGHNGGAGGSTYDDHASIRMHAQHTAMDDLIPIGDGDIKFDYNPALHQHHHSHEQDSVGPHQASHDIDPLSQLGPPPSSSTSDPYATDAFPQVHRPSTYGFNANFGAGFTQAPLSPSNSYGATAPNGSWTNGFGSGGGMSFDGPGFPSASGSGSGPSGAAAAGTVAGGRRLSQRANSFWLRRPSLAGDLAGVGLGEF